MITFNSEKFKREIKNELSEVFRNSFKSIKEFIDLMSNDTPAALGVIMGFLTIILLIAMGQAREGKENLFSQNVFLKAIKNIYDFVTLENMQLLLTGALFFGVFIYMCVIAGMIFVKALTSIEVD